MRGYSEREGECSEREVRVGEKEDVFLHLIEFNSQVQSDRWERMES